MRIVSVLVAVAVAGCGSNNGVVTADNGVKACATVVSCGIPLGGRGISGCSEQVSGVNNPDVARIAHVVTSPEVNCLAAAGKDCDAARRCLNGGQEPQACSGGGKSCTATSVTSCSDLTGTGGKEATSQFPCADIGEMCVASAREVDCGLGTCSGGDTCMGDVLMQCDGRGILHNLNCANYDATCAVTLGIAHCRGKGPTCTAPVNPFQGIRCDGNSIVYCFDGQEAKLDCGTLQTSCFANAKGQPFACALGNECDPGSFTTTCTGTVLTFCNNGKNAQLDCARLGFTQCQAQSGGSCS